MGDAEDSGAVAIAFALTTGAGLATALGAGLVFFKNVRLGNEKVLAVAMGFSAGVMLYVSFAEILTKSDAAFQEAGLSEGSAYAAATGTFFAGVMLTVLIHYLVHWLDASYASKTHEAEQNIPENVQRITSEAEPAEAASHGIVRRTSNTANAAASEDTIEIDDDIAIEVGSESSATSIPVQVQPADDLSEADAAHTPDTATAASTNLSADTSHDIETNTQTTAAAPAMPAEDALIAPPPAEQRALTRTGLITALAIGLHNFPEGLATFVAALEDPAVGTALAVAIAIHNIPEGLAVSIPVYYATGSRTKAFLWALFSGVSEPIGALLGYIVLRTAFSQTAYGVLFGLVGGMMVHISISELLPTAFKYDKSQRMVAPAVVAGMAAMALSLVLFAL